MRAPSSKARLELQIPNTDQTVRPFYIEYRLVDLDVREVVAEFGDLLTSTHARNRFMNVQARVGSYKLDSSNFVSDDVFRGFIGPTGQVGVDRDYDSLRQDLWIATDQAFKEALDTYSKKKGYLSSLARQSDIDDFSKTEPVELIQPLETPDWTNRNWEQEARDSSAVMRAFSQIHESRVSYYLVYATEYLLTSEGTEIRENRSFAAIEAGMNAVADDGVPVNHYYATYAVRPADLPNVDGVRKGLNVTCTELMALRSAPPAQDYTGPVLFEARAAASLLAQVLSPAINGARPPISFSPVLEQMLTGLGGKSDWVGRISTRVLAPSVTLVDDPGAKEFKGSRLVGGYTVDEQGVRGQKITLVENGVLKGELMSRRPGSDFEQSNGHGRSAFLSDAKPTMSNLIFSFSELLASFGGGAGTGDRLPLIVYRVYPDTGREEMVRGARLVGLSTRTLRNIAGIGNDDFVFNHVQSQGNFAGTAFSAFGSAQVGLPASIVAPSLLFDEVEARGERAEAKRLALLPPPPMTAAK